MPIPVDQYTTAIGDSFLARAYANLLGNDLFFYVSTTNEFRVKNAANNSIVTLVPGVRWMCLIQASGLVHLYYSLLNGVIYYAPFTTANYVAPLVATVTGLSSPATFSACYAPTSTPTCSARGVDYGRRHPGYTSSSPDMRSLLGKIQTYNNNVSQAYLVNEPVMAIHANDTNAVTINVMRTTVSNGYQQVGFYVVQLPGVS